MSQRETWAVVVAAGRGERVGAGFNKLFVPLCGRPVLAWTMDSLASSGVVDGFVLVCAQGETRAAMDAARDATQEVLPVVGGATRADSVREGLLALPEHCEIALIHDGARPFPAKDTILRCVDSARTYGSGIAAQFVTDTIKRENGGIAVETIDRETLRAVQTPQAFLKKEILAAYCQHGIESATDDAEVYARAGGEVRLVQGDAMNIKITTQQDISVLDSIMTGRGMIRVGNGYDAHRLVPGRALILCGVNIEHERGLLGHSDADAATHALIDALLGACAMGDIGKLFPDTDGRFKDADSIELLRETVRHIKGNGFHPAQADITIIAQRPKLLPYIEHMRNILSCAMGIDVSRIGIKAKTTEGMGFAGREEGISAQASAVVYENVMHSFFTSRV